MYTMCLITVIVIFLTENEKNFNPYRKCVEGGSPVQQFHTTGNKNKCNFTDPHDVVLLPCRDI